MTATAGDVGVRRQRKGFRLSPSSAFQAVIPLACLTIFGGLALLHAAAPELYRRLLTLLMLAPFPRPFMDWEIIPASIECWGRGVDVYVDNLCYAPLPHLVFAYSPLWLRATFIPVGTVWVNPAGIALATAFFLSLGLLPPTPRRRDLAIMLGAAGSSLVSFAVERGNVDLLMFVLAAIGIRLWTGSLRFRLLAYALFTAAGLLKFYPFILLTLALRERVRIFLPIALSFLLTLGWFVGTFHEELLEARKVIPVGPYFTDLWGAVNLPYGLGALGLPALTAIGIEDGALAPLVGRGLPALLLLLLAIEAVRRALRLSERHGLRAALAALPVREVGFLVAGALLVCGCFFTGQSIGYRGIFLLLVVPGVLRLARTLPDPGARRIFSGTAAAILLVLWVLTIQFFLVAFDLSARPAGDASALGIVHWLLHEAAWWWIVSVLLALIIGFVANAATARAVAGRVLSRRPSPHAS